MQRYKYIYIYFPYLCIFLPFRYPHFAIHREFVQNKVKLQPKIHAKKLAFFRKKHYLRTNNINVNCSIFPCSKFKANTKRTRSEHKALSKMMENDTISTKIVLFSHYHN